MSKRNRGPRAPSTLAQELVQALLGNGWHEAPGRRNGQPRGGPAATAATLGRGGAGPEAARGPQWQCPTCSVLNDVGRKTCRRCAASKPHGSAARQRPPPAARTEPRPWLQPKVTLGSLAAVAKSAGASEEVVTQLSKEASAAKGVRQTPGGRLDSARARVERGEKKAAATRDSLVAAREKLLVAEAQAAEAELEEDSARAELATVEAEVARAPACESTLLEGVRALLLRLESTPRGSSPGAHTSPPETVLKAMYDLHAAMDAAGTCQPSQATLPETMAATIRGEQSLDDVADVRFGEAELLVDSDEETAAAGPTQVESARASRSGAEPAEERHGSRTPPRARGETGKGASSGPPRR